MNGHKVLVKVTNKIKDYEYKGEVIKILGHKNDPGVDILSIVAKYGINDVFPDNVHTHGPADQDYILESPVIDQIFYVLCEMCKVHSCLGPVRIAMTAKVEAQDMILLCECRNLLCEEMSVAVPPMDENDIFSVATLFIINLCVVICAEKRHPITSFAN